MQHRTNRGVCAVRRDQQSRTATTFAIRHPHLHIATHGLAGTQRHYFRGRPDFDLWTDDTLCFTCHGSAGKGDGPAGAALTPPPRDFSVGDFKFDADKNGTPGEDADLTLVIKNGAGAYGGNPSMAPWGHLSDQDVADLVAYVRSLKQ
jgi:hypothetical protein